MAYIKIGGIKVSPVPIRPYNYYIGDDTVKTYYPLAIIGSNTSDTTLLYGPTNDAQDGSGHKFSVSKIDSTHWNVTIKAPNGTALISANISVGLYDNGFKVVGLGYTTDGYLKVFSCGGGSSFPTTNAALNGLYSNNTSFPHGGESITECNLVPQNRIFQIFAPYDQEIAWGTYADFTNALPKTDSDEIMNNQATDESPYTNGPTNKGAKGGDGKWVNPQPPTPVPSLPSNTILEAGLLNCYKVTFSDLERIASFLFDGNVINELMKVGTTLFDYMDGMYQVPVAVSTGGNEVMALGNVFSGGGAIASAVSLPTVTEQYYEVDCGTVEVEEYWGNALDYSPYTKVTIMLPYIGAKELSADEVVGKTLHLKYHIDILSGACVAFLYESLTGGEQAVLYEFSGNCIMQLPLRQTDHAELIKGVLDTALAASAGAAVVGHGVAAVEAAGTAKQTAAAHITAEKQFASTESSAVTGIASNVTGAKVNVQRTGNLAGAQGFLGIQKPYLIIQRPTQAYPENMGHYKGFPCNQEARLGDLSGFTVVDSIRLNGLVGTEPEIAEIYDLLSKGVII